MLPQLQPGLGVSILIVQHMPPIFTKGLADSLAAKCAIGVKEAQDGDVLKPDFAYIAPGGRQMMVIPASNGRKVIRITDDPPENSCKPSVDYLFRSVARYFPGKTLVLIMTGMGNDGTSGLRLLKPQGAITVAQDEASCVVFGMPREAIQAGVIDYVFPLDRLALELTRLLQGAGL
jgi:two-component system chemotaxis response regulator CheB